VIATIAVLLMGLFVLALHQLLVGRALVDTQGHGARGAAFGVDALAIEQLSGAASVRVGRAIFAGLLGLLTVITLVIAPALASGVISTEREKQTMELLTTAPISTLGLVIGKLAASLAYVLLVIAASLPLMCIAFAFGGIGPEDIVNAYVMVLALAFGAAAIGLYLSALLGRTQVAAIASYLVLIALAGGSLVLHAWLAGGLVLSQRGFDGGGDHGGNGRERARRQAPQALLVLNPLVADLDIVCTAMPDVRGACSLTFAAGPARLSIQDPPRTSFWPRSALAFVGVGGVLMLLTTQHISPSRRIRPLRSRPWRRLRHRRRPSPSAAPDADVPARQADVPAPDA
jgi:hypothetical protein